MQGFVLPYVLVAVALLAAVTIFAAQNLSRGADTLIRLERSSEIDLAFHAAETEALLWILTAQPNNGGYQKIRQLPARGGLNVTEPIGRLWGVKGDMRRIETSFGPVFVSLQDVTGLISLRTPDEDLFVKFMRGFNILPSESKGLLAALQDYQDVDSRRRFQGAEAIDYRQRGLPLPTNQEIRSLAELPRILGWPEALAKIDMEKFERFVSLSSRVSSTRDTHLSPALARHLNARAPTAARGRVSSNVFANDNFPSPVFRLMFEAVMVNAEGQMTLRRRVVEYTSTVNRLAVPMKNMSGQSLLATSVSIEIPEILLQVGMLFSEPLQATMMIHQ